MKIPFQRVAIGERFLADGEWYIKVSLLAAVHRETGSTHPFRPAEEDVVNRQISVQKKRRKAYAK